MKTIKINFVNFWDSFKKDKNLFYNILSKHFDVEISDDPDFIICSNRGNTFEYTKYNCVRLMFMGENMSPDWTAVDYCIGFDYMDFGDRYFRLPFAFYSDKGKPLVFPEISKDSAKKILSEKKYFCDFIYGHQSASNMREQLFDKLSEYKEVLSPGSFLNNTSNNNKRCSWNEKNEYQKLSKFSIACDSISYPGFVTEKIVGPFKCHSIPIYCGSPRINEDFNEEAFIWCKDESQIEETVKRVEYLDNNDEAYIEMLMKQPFVNKNQEIERYERLENWLVNIFSQEPEKAYRRVRYFAADRHVQALKKYYSHNKQSKAKWFFRQIKKHI